MDKQLRAKVADDICSIASEPAIAGFDHDGSWANHLSAPIVLTDQVSTSNTHATSAIALSETDSITQAVILAKSGIKPTVLVFASATRCGGGYRNGAVAQEEDISLTTTWTFQAKNAESFYQAGAQSKDAIYNNAVIWIEQARILASAPGDWLESPLPCSFIGFAAPNARGLESQGYDVNDPKLQRKIEEALLRRCQITMSVAKNNAVEHLVLGAIGCGVFKLNPRMVARCWHASIDMSGYAGDITFALPSGPESEIWTAFSERFDADLKTGKGKAKLSCRSR